MMKKTKKLISVLLAIVLTMTVIQLSGIVASAETLTGTCGDNLTWTFDDATGVLTVSGTGDMYDYDGGLKTPWYDVRSTIVEIVIGDGVTSIGNYAFQKTGVDVITVSDTVEEIGNYAFYGSTGVVELNLGANVKAIGNYAFSSAFKLEELVLPESLVTIGNDAFNNSRVIEEIVIPDSVVTIGDYAFSHCKAAKYLYIGASAGTFPVKAFQGCDSIERIQVSEDNSYYSNDAYGVLFNKTKTKLVLYPSAAYESYKIPDTVQVIGTSAFCMATNGSNNLTSLTMSTNLKTIESSGLCGLNNITSLEFYPGLETIGISAFQSCDNLQSITLPDTVKSIGRRAFVYCTSFTTVNYAGSEEQWSEISIDTFDNEYLLNAQINYLYGHTCEFGYWAITTPATCTESGVETRSCTCGASETRETAPTGHTAGEWEMVSEATCSATGSKTKSCTACGVTLEEEEIPATEHNDSDGDGICDECYGELNSDNGTDGNDEPDNNEQSCDHACHKSGIAGFFWRITRFFNMLFGTNQYCSCGEAHY